jgi:uncharacterized protein (DUF2141 family)
MVLSVTNSRFVRPPSSARRSPWRLAKFGKTLLLSLVFMSIGTLPVRAANLTITIEGVHSNAGEILIGLYDRADAFKLAIDSSATKSALLPQTWRIAGASLRAKTGSQSIIFTQLPPGRYAVIAFHDENDNGLLDANALGVPTEGYGFSNDAHGFLSAPSFDAAAVELGSVDKIISIPLLYHRAPTAQDQADLNQQLLR